MTYELEMLLLAATVFLVWRQSSKPQEDNKVNHLLQRMYDTESSGLTLEFERLINEVEILLEKRTQVPPLDLCRMTRLIASVQNPGNTRYSRVFRLIYREVMLWDAVPPRGAFLLRGAFGHVRVLTNANWIALKNHLDSLPEIAC